MKRTLLILAGLGVSAVVADQVFRATVHDAFTQRQLMFTTEAPADVLLANATLNTAPLDLGAEGLPTPEPFVEAFPFDDEAHTWTNCWDAYSSGGATVFDANGDGRLDVYIARDGASWTRPTDEDAVLASEPRPQPNMLYINQGNDADGRPIFKRHDELAAANDTFVAEELLIEDYLVPRASTSDDRARPGRDSSMGLAVDINGDGRQDLIVANVTEGSFWSAPEVQRVLSRFVDPIGRQARSSKLPITSLINHFLGEYVPGDGLHVTRETGRGLEPEGSNSVYLNMGDADGDGAPEWKDVTHESGLGGQRPTTSLIAADVDLDGDVDIYEGNVLDPDYWLGGSTGWAGSANNLYINQLAETGELRFVEKSAEMGVDGLFDEDYPQHEFSRVKRIPGLPDEYSLFRMEPESYTPDPLSINGQEHEQGEITWSTVFQDVNADGYPDIWVANDFGILRLYINEGGERFVNAEHARSSTTGTWMSFAPGDFNGDGEEDLFVGNMGGGMHNHVFVQPDAYAMFDPIITDSAAFGLFVTDRHDPTHALIDGADLSRELPHSVRHSDVLPPDTSLPNNVRTMDELSQDRVTPFDRNTLDAYEFAWGMTPIDVQNDGRLDVYVHGSLYGRGGGLFAALGTNPGRLLVNATPEGGEMRWVDLTAEHHAFNILELQYDKLEDEGFIYRRSPQQNWSKRDMVYSYDRSSWSAQGLVVQERATNSDLLQTAENGRAAVGADLNGDGFADLLLTAMGGYDSRSSSNKNLQIDIDGRARVVPAPDNNFPVLTNFEPGYTRVFLNTYTEAGWIKVQLHDDSAHNPDAIGAVVRVNGAQVQHVRAGTGGYVASLSSELIFGLGDGSAQQVEIIWPDAERTTTTLELEELQNGTLIVRKSDASTRWVPAGDGLSDGAVDTNTPE